MKYKKIVALASVCAVLGLGVYFSENRQSSSVSSNGGDGNPGINDPAKITGIKTTAKDSAASLILKDGIWRVAEKQEFPADFNMVSDIVRQFQEMKIERSFEADDETLKRIGLVAGAGSSDTAPSTVSFFDSENRPLAEYVIGSSRKGGGQYFMKKDSKTVYLSLRELSGLGRMPKDMMNRQIINADKAELIKISCEKGDQKIYSLEKQKDSDQFILNEKEEGRDVDSSKITGLKGFISPFIIDDIAVEKIQSPPDAVSVSFELKDGTVCRIVDAGKKADGASGSAYVNVEISKKGENSKNTGKNESGESSLFLKGIDITKYTFIIPEWKKDVVVTDKANLYVKVPDSDSKEAGMPDKAADSNH